MWRSRWLGLVLELVLYWVEPLSIGGIVWRGREREWGWEMIDDVDWQVRLVKQTSYSFILEKVSHVR